MLTHFFKTIQSNNAVNKYKKDVPDIWLKIPKQKVLKYDTKDNTLYEKVLFFFQIQDINHSLAIFLIWKTALSLFLSAFQVNPDLAIKVGLHGAFIYAFSYFVNHKVINLYSVHFLFSDSCGISPSSVSWKKHCYCSVPKNV